jgi:carbamoyl-phosphate synthase large subunit
MEHIEEAGIHSGDSACSLPPYTLSPAIVAELKRQTEAMALALGVRGLMNVQFAIQGEDDLRAGGQPARLAHRALRGQGGRARRSRQDRRAGHGGRAASAFDLTTQGDTPHVAVKEAVLPFNRFPGVDTLLGPGDEIDRRGHGPRPQLRAGVPESQLGAGVILPDGAAAFISVRDADKAAMLEAARILEGWASASSPPGHGGLPDRAWRVKAERVPRSTRAAPTSSTG